MFGKGLQAGLPPQQRRSLPPLKSGKGMHINPSPLFGSWEDYKENDVRRRSAFQFWFNKLVQIP